MPRDSRKPNDMPSLTSTVLLVEDDMDTRDLLARVLSAEGIAVRLAANGWEGLLAVENPPDLILLDIMLPGMDGVSFLRSLRNTHGYERVPVVVVTALDIADVAPRVQPYRVEQIISKGDNLLSQLRLALRRTLDRPPHPNHVDLPTPGTNVRPYLDLYFKMLAWG